MPRKKSNTCIAVVRNNRGKVIVAADRRESWGPHQAAPTPFPKVIKRDGLILAGAGDGYLCDLFTRQLNIPQKGMHDIDNYMYNIFMPQVWRFLQNHGLATKDKDLKLSDGTEAEIVLVLYSNVYVLVLENLSKNTGGQLAIYPVSLPYAVGCGDHLARGSLRTNELRGFKNTKENLIMALEIAAEISPGCGDGVDIVSE